MSDEGTSRGAEMVDEDQRVKRAVARALERQLPALIARLAGRTSGGGTVREEDSKYTPLHFLPPGMTGAIAHPIFIDAMWVG